MSEVSKVIGKYVLRECLGSGAMGSVWLSSHPRLNLPVAVKVLSRSLAKESTEYVERFIEEGRLAAAINHPNVIRIYDADHDQGYHYLVMEYVDGCDVEKMAAVRQGNCLEILEIIEIALKVSEALEEAQEHKIIHRDIKPENILVTQNGKIKLADLGIAKKIGSDSSVTETGYSLGTPYYMSPEQALNVKSIDHRSDIYSLGATMYHLLTGEVPYKGDSPFATMMMHSQESLEHPQARKGDLPDEVCAIVCKMMEKNPNDRYQSYEELRTDLTLCKFNSSELSDLVSNYGFDTLAKISIPKKAAKKKALKKATPVPVVKKAQRISKDMKTLSPNEYIIDFNDSAKPVMQKAKGGDDRKVADLSSTQASQMIVQDIKKEQDTIQKNKSAEANKLKKKPRKKSPKNLTQRLRIKELKNPKLRWYEKAIVIGFWLLGPLLILGYFMFFSSEAPAEDSELSSRDTTVPVLKPISTKSTVIKKPLIRKKLTVVKAEAIKRVTDNKLTLEDLVNSCSDKSKVVIEGDTLTINGNITIQVDGHLKNKSIRVARGFRPIIKSKKPRGLIIEGGAISVYYASQVRMESVILSKVKLGKWSRYYRYPYSSKWEFKDCLFYQTNLGIKTTDYGYKYQDCVFVESNFSASRTVSSEKQYQDQWNVVDNCIFYKCVLSPQFLFSTKDCSLLDCTLNKASSAYTLKEGLVVPLLTAEPKTVDELNQAVNNPLMRFVFNSSSTYTGSVLAASNETRILEVERAMKSLKSKMVISLKSKKAFVMSAPKNAPKEDLNQYVDEHLGFVGHKHSDNKYNFNIVEGTKRTKLNLWVDPINGSACRGWVYLISPEGRKTHLLTWSPQLLKNLRLKTPVRSFLDLKPIEIDISPYISLTGEYTVEFKQLFYNRHLPYTPKEENHTANVDGLIIYRAELKDHWSSYKGDLKEHQKGAFYHEGKLIKMFKEALTWEEADKKSRAMGGKLYCVDTSDEHWILRHQYNGQSFWVGAKETDSKLEYVNGESGYDYVSTHFKPNTGLPYVALERRKSRSYSGGTKIMDYYFYPKNHKVNQFLCEWGGKPYRELQNTKTASKKYTGVLFDKSYSLEIFKDEIIQNYKGTQSTYALDKITKSGDLIIIEWLEGVQRKTIIDLKNEGYASVSYYEKGIRKWQTTLVKKGSIKSYSNDYHKNFIGTWEILSSGGRGSSWQPGKKFIINTDLTTNYKGVFRTNYSGVVKPGTNALSVTHGKYTDVFQYPYTPSKQLYTLSDGRELYLKKVSDGKDWAKIKISGKGYSLNTLKNGENAWLNRTYKWLDIPSQFEGLDFAKKYGGANCTINITCEESGYIYLLGKPNDSYEETGYVVGYSDRKGTKMPMTKRYLKKDQKLVLQTKGWSDGVLILPQTESTQSNSVYEMLVTLKTSDVKNAGTDDIDIYVQINNDPRFKYKLDNPGFNDLERNSVNLFEKIRCSIESIDKIKTISIGTNKGNDAWLFEAAIFQFFKDGLKSRPIKFQKSLWFSTEKQDINELRAVNKYDFKITDPIKLNMNDLSSTYIWKLPSTVWAGERHYNNIHKFKITAEVNKPRLTYYINSATYSSTNGIVILKTPQNKNIIISKWDSSIRNIKINCVNAYSPTRKEGTKVDVDLSLYLTDLGEYSLQFLYKSGKAAAAIYDAEIKSMPKISVK
ncbi:serine/threonine protein kinase [Lentisphaera araneosa HTCC2155]|uniref:non-specific serine/threonine protein kinase n=1 Tax=Lentisphaera araneosa HTCC2155 TaxID=313628 RepID=A6DRG3_9BACT|nr:serine/threonine-protein kinase [Lentisphaera araneosa]EDM25773.1 serine/threonine protein kinase [Lentisphaera araneosa HTCC2155]